LDKKLVGKITHYFDKISVAIVEVSAPLKVGDKISIEKGEEVFEQTIDSMQVEKKAVQAAKAGDAVGVKTAQPVKRGSEVFKIS
jgi:translation initiation factor IF-2